MLYLKNSLVNLTIILLSFFFITVSLANTEGFIFPKKKIILIKTVDKKNIKIEKNNGNNQEYLPQKKTKKKKKKIKKKKKKIKKKNKFVK